MKEAMDELWKAYLSPPVGRDLIFFCNLLNEHDQRFTPNFLENFTVLFNALRGSLPIDNLPEHLLKILKKVDWKHDFPWNPKADPQYLVAKSLMLKLFHHVKEKIKQRERKQRRKEMKLKIDEAISLSSAIDDLWMSFLTPPRGHLRSLIAVMVNGDSRFPNEFFNDFVDLFNHLCGFNTTGKTEYVKIFQEVEWNAQHDPDYEIPKSLMNDLFEDLIENLWAELEVKQVVSSEEIEENKKNKRMLMEELAKKSAALNKKVYREGRLGRDVVKKEAQVKNLGNRFKNTGKK